jgi:hypothetical protein
MSPSAQDRARALAIAQDFGTEALELNRQLVAADPADTASRTRLARCFVHAGRLDEGEAEYREVLRLEPKNRIAAGGLETIERQRHQGDAVVERAVVRRAAHPLREPPSRPRSSGLSSLAHSKAGPVPQIFTGFQRRDFTELQVCPRNEIQARFGPRVVDLLKRVNALQSSEEIAGIREPGRRQLFRLSRAEVHTRAGQWFVHHGGGRWEPQFAIGMYGGVARSGDWLRVGLGFDMSDRGNDPDPATGIREARAAFARFQRVLASPRRSLFLGWMIKENGRIEYNEPGPRLDLHEASQAAELLTAADPSRAEWVFLGRWLSPEQADEADILSNPVLLVRTIDRVLAGLLPLWRAIRE